ncbi:MAG: hypothetical protein HUJ72_08600 [Blautia sp.]|nr:hypothetical protein [Blautia sp.]
MVDFSFVVSTKEEIEIETEIRFQQEMLSKIKTTVTEGKRRVSIMLHEAETKGWNFYEDLTWSPENPRLFDVTFRVISNGYICDEVTSYFGMRKISIENGHVLLNNRPYIQKLVLDQGYWPESLITAPDDDSFVKDIMLIKEMGFNGARIHQKVEDPRFLYHADRLGLLIWGEIGSAYVYSPEYAKNMYAEWQDCIERDYNHPCIVAWVPLNESWGVQEIKTDLMQQAHSMALVYMTKSLDDTRIVIDNDGWEHTGGDLCTIHDYESNPEILRNRYADFDNIMKYYPGGRSLYSDGYSYNGAPVLVTEFGGISFSVNSDDGWGYSSETDSDEYVKHIAGLVDAILDSPFVEGYCYTQLCDIETEQNGLLYYDRTPKVDLQLIRTANRE